MICSNCGVEIEWLNWKYDNLCLDCYRKKQVGKENFELIIAKYLPDKQKRKLSLGEKK